MHTPFSSLLSVTVPFICVALLYFASPVRAQSTTTSASPVTPVLYPNYVTAWSYMSVYEDEAAEWAGVPSTFGREGAAYGDEGEEYGFLVGGANLNAASNPTAYGDIWLLNITSDTFISCGSLPNSSTLYYSQAEWNEASEQLVIVGGVQSAPSAAQESYFTNLSPNTTHHTTHSSHSTTLYTAHSELLYFLCDAGTSYSFLAPLVLLPTVLVWR